MSTKQTGAMRAAEIFFPKRDKERIKYAAEIIERETHCGEMIEVLETLTSIAEIMDNRHHAGIKLLSYDWSELNHAIGTTVIAKVKGE